MMSMRRIFAVFTLALASVFVVPSAPVSLTHFAAISSPASAQSPAQRLLILAPKPAPASTGGGCAEATTFLARLSSHTWDTAYTTMICGLVTDGVWAKLDLLYIFATQNSTDALLNLPSVKTTVLSATAPTFTANTGFAGNGTSATINVTGYDYSTGPQFTQNSASIFGWSTLSSADNGFLVGNSASFNSTLTLTPFSFGSSTSASVNGGTGITSSTLANGLGLFTASRTSSVQLDVYQNATNTGSSGANASSAITSANAWFLGTGGLGFYGGGIAAGGAGAGLTGTDVTNLYNRVHTMLHTVNAGTFP